MSGWRQRAVETESSSGANIRMPPLARSRSRCRRRGRGMAAGREGGARGGALHAPAAHVIVSAPHPLVGYLIVHSPLALVAVVGSTLGSTRVSMARWPRRAELEGVAFLARFGMSAPVVGQPGLAAVTPAWVCQEGGRRWSSRTYSDGAQWVSRSAGPCRVVDRCWRSMLWFSARLGAGARRP